MWFERIFRRRDSAQTEHVEEIFDDQFIHRMERLSLRAERFLRGGIAGNHRSLRHVPAAEFSGHRNYTLGDDLRFVDWSAAARRDDVLVRLGNAPQDVTVHILVDCSQSMGFGSPAKLLTAQRLVAALAYIALTHGDRVMLSSFASGILSSFGPIQGRMRFTELMRFISDLKPAERTSVTAALREAADKTPFGGLLILLSDCLTDEPLDKALSGLVLPRWQVMILHILDPNELDPDLRGNIALEDSETGEQAMYDVDAKTLAKYKRSVVEWCDRLEHTCFSAGATYVRFTSDQSLDRMIIPLLQQRRFLEPR